MKRFLFTSLIVCVLCSVVSCGDEDVTSYMPTWKGFQVTPEMAIKGDTLKVVAVQEQIGHLIYQAKYDWTLAYTFENSKGIGQDTTVTFTSSVCYDAQPQDPEMKFAVPQNILSSIEVNFVGTYSYSAQGTRTTDGSIYSDYAGSLRQSQSSTLFGKSTGRVTVKVQGL